MKKSKPSLRERKSLGRRWLTGLRMFRYGVNNFTRNAWLTTAATAIMTITLLIVFSAVVARNMLTDTVTTFKQRLDISIYFRDDVTAADVTTMSAKLRANDTVNSVRYIGLDEARANYIKKFNPSVDDLRVIADLPTSPFPPELRVTVKDPSNLTSLEALVKTDKTFTANLNPDPRLTAATFSGDRRKVITNISGWIAAVDRAGLFAGGLFVGISMLIVFNTIRMAIFNRRDEIEMMKLIGADKGFIRGPFVVEATMYGFVAASVATGLGIAGLFAVEPQLATYGITSRHTHDLVLAYAPLILLAMLAVGAFIGITSSRLAVRRYLRV
jgi:cell division transport system permease protein